MLHQLNKDLSLSISLSVAQIKLFIWSYCEKKAEYSTVQPGDRTTLLHTLLAVAWWSHTTILCANAH